MFRIKSTRCAAIAALVFFASSVTCSAIAEVPTLDDYFGKAILRDIALSPDGSKLAVIRWIDESENWRLMVIDVTESASLIAAIDEPEGMKLLGLRWLRNDRLGLAVSKSKKAGGRTWHFKRMIAINSDGSKGVELLNDQKILKDNLNLTNIVSVLPTMPNHVLMTGRHNLLSLYRVNIRTGHSDRIAQGGTRTFAFLVNKNGEPSLRFDREPYTRKIITLAYEKESDKWKRISTILVSEFEEQFNRQLASFEGNTTVLMLDRRDEDEYIKLHRYDIKKEEFEDVAYEIAGYDIHSPILDVYTDEIYGVSYITDRLQYAFFDENLQRVQDQLESQFPNGQVRIKNISADKDTYLFFTDEPWRKGSWHLYKAQSGEFLEVADLAPQMRASALTSVHEVQYRSFDRTLIKGYLTFPKNGEDTKLPLIVYPHGGPLGRDWLSYDPIVQYWATRGYAVFQPNFRGSSGYGRTFQDSGNLEYGDAMIEDIASGIRSLINAGRVDPDRICAAGVSYGGYATLMLAVKTDLIQCAVSINGPVDYRLRISNVTKKTKNKESRSELREWMDKTVGNIDTQTDLLDEQSPLRRAAEITVPVLLIHARDDSNVNIKHSRKMHKALEKLGKDVKLIELERGGHSLAYKHAERKMLMETSVFFAEHLKPDEVAAEAE